MPNTKVAPINDEEIKSENEKSGELARHDTSADEKLQPQFAFSANSEVFEDKSRMLKELNDLVIDAECEELGKVSPPPSYEESDSVLDIEDETLEEEEDPWSIVITPSTSTPWKELTILRKIGRVCMVTVKIMFILLLLYFFICSLDLLGAAFQLIGGRTAGEAFQSPLMQNPMCGLIIGVWVTVILQSSSTTTSIVVTMVAANLLDVQQAIYIIMGSNIGTSFTSSLVALGQVAERNQFRRAFAGSIVLYIFNLLTVTILLPIEFFFGYLYYVTKAMVDSMDLVNTAVDGNDEPMFLSVITDPLISLIIQVDKDVVSAIAEDSFQQKRPLTKYLCEEVDHCNYTDYPLGTDVTEQDEYVEARDSTTHPLLWTYDEQIDNETLTDNGTETDIVTNDSAVTRFSYMLPDFEDPATQTCKHLFVGAGLPSDYEELDGWPRIYLSDAVVGIILLIIALFVLCACLIGMVKLLNSLLKGPVLGVVRKTINSDLPGGKVGREITGYLVILIGAFLTILVQSSSVFTSALNPLIGIGIVTLDRTYPLTLGANIGTTITALLAAFTADPETIADALQVAYAHLMFNITGILLFYPIPKIRKFPCWLSQMIGDITADYRWFAVFFLCMTYIIVPLFVFAISIPGPEVLVAVLTPILLFFAIIIVINYMQYKYPSKLPKSLQNWDWLPLALHSLEPYDKLLRKVCPCKICQVDKHKDDETRRHSTDELPPITMEVTIDTPADSKASLDTNTPNSDSGNVSPSQSQQDLASSSTSAERNNEGFVETEHL